MAELLKPRTAAEVVIMNLPGAKTDMNLNLEHPAKDTLTGEEGRSFVIPPGDGRILVRKSNEAAGVD